MVNVSIVLDIFFCIFGGKMTSQNGVKILIFYFVHLFGSDGRGPLPNIKGKKNSKISESRCRSRLFSVLTLFQDLLSATAVKSITI